MKLHEIPKLQAHRGYWIKGAKENTLDAFRAARSIGAEMIELDIHLSKDQVPVVYHDYNLKKFGHENLKISELSYDEIFKISGAPKLEQVLLDSEVPKYKNIEIKSHDLFFSSIEFRVSELVKKLNVEDTILFSSFNPFSLLRLRFLLPDIPRALLVSAGDEKANRVYLKKMWFKSLAKPDLLHLEHVMITEDNYKAWISRGLPIAVWTVNDPNEIKKYLSWGVCSVISDTLG